MGCGVFVCGVLTVLLSLCGYRPQYCANLALKVNVKLDGVNSRITGDTSSPSKFLPVVRFGWGALMLLLLCRLFSACS